MSLADDILSQPYRRMSFSHWFDVLDEATQIECLVIWHRFRSGQVDRIPASVLGQRLKDAIPEIKVTPKQIAIWLADERGVERASAAVREAAAKRLK